MEEIRRHFSYVVRCTWRKPVLLTIAGDVPFELSEVMSTMIDVGFTSKCKEPTIFNILIGEYYYREMGRGFPFPLSLVLKQRTRIKVEYKSGPKRRIHVVFKGAKIYGGTLQEAG